ncbi:hypothetical protein HYH03_012167 [Edaphochlamys debaryana]|uniref:Uncharacterized protein n=1 Tax=Edaphochlamys debaryana TaxID=47281 RepID=A0A835XTE8_9CHLO|nr:hypothetical protein HYH03_012167 [Edaphochlamys debaryana]|eukprot:KAG2489337.1 hypothetical protein HYH03_012167 [Edaphochlamys debaryana]
MGLRAPVLLAVLLGMARQMAAQPSHAECQALTDHYLDKHHKEAEPYTGKNLLYFLHVPRTAGRTFHSCLLKMATHPARRCPKAYDHLRLTNMTNPNCFLLSSHDDFSVVSMLPPDAAVLTQLRDPLDRFLSAYEFAIEVASRSLKRPKNYKKKVGRIATEDVWPWSYLIPFFQADLQSKVPKVQDQVLPEGGRWAEVEQDGDRFYYNKVLNKSKWNLTEEERTLNGGVLPLLDPYNNELVMSLKEFAEHPIATELLHNGATFQVLGITNYSHWGDAAQFRGCLKAQASVEEHMLQVAKDRVRRFSHVGTTDRLFDSAAAAVGSLGLSTDSPAYSGGDDDVAGHGGTRASRTSGGAQRRHTRGASSLAAQLQLLAKLVREARQRLQTAQTELVDAQRSGGDHGVIELLRNRVDKARQDLIDAQDKLSTTRDQLPADLGGAGGDSSSDTSYHHRRRLLAEEEGSHGSEEGDIASGHVGEEGAPVTDTGADGAGADSQADAEGAGEQYPLDSEGEEEASHRRRLAFRNIEVGQTDAFGNPLDPEFKKIANSNIAAEFVRCANRAQARSNSRREQSLAALSYPDGRSVLFSKAARKRIPAEVLDLIRSHNKLDTQLHALGLEMLAKRIEELKEAGNWDPVPEQPHERRKGGDGKRTGRLPRPDEEEEKIDDELRRL